MEAVDGEARRGWPAALAALLTAVTLAVFWPGPGATFLNYDDDLYVTANPSVLAGLSADGVRWAAGSYHAANWHPLTWLSHMLDVELFGVDAVAHRRTSAVLHALAALLCFLALRDMTRASVASAFAAALFALHPLRVESVAWVAERKDVLAACFAAGVLLAYARYVRAQSPVRMALVALLLGLGLAAKPSLVPLPLGLLLLDRWPLARTEPLAVRLREKVPLFLLAAGSALATWVAQSSAGTLDELAGVAFAPRAAAAARAVGAYLADLVWPSDLAFFYPHPLLVGHPDGLLVPTATALAAVTALTILAVRTRRSLPWIAVGWSWFLLFLLPVLGLVPLGAHARADRYTYLPSLGLAVAVVWTLRELTRARPAVRTTVIAVGLAWLGVLSALTVQQKRTWASTETLTLHALEVTERNYLAHTNLAALLEARGDTAGALEHYLAALDIRPRVAPVQLRAAELLRARGELDAAAEHYTIVAHLEPDFLSARLQLGLLLAGSGRDVEALPHLRHVWTSERTASEHRAAVGTTLSWVLSTSPDPAARDGLEARTVAEACLAAGRTPQALEALAAAEAELGRFEAAAEVEREALALMPPTARSGAQARLELYLSGRPYRRPRS